MFPREFIKRGLFPLLVLTVAVLVSCELGTGPQTGPDPGDGSSSNNSGDATDGINSAFDPFNPVSVTCPAFPNTFALAPAPGTPSYVLSEPVVLVAPEATFIVTALTSGGEFGKVSEIVVSVFTEEAYLIARIRAGSGTDGNLKVGRYFTEVFPQPTLDLTEMIETTEMPTTTITTISPVVSIAMPAITSLRCDSQNGDYLEILELRIDPLSGATPEIKQFQAMFRLDCIQGCISIFE